MSLQEAIEDLKKQIAENEEEKEEVVEATEEEVVEEVVEEEKTEEAEEEKAEEEKKEEKTAKEMTPDEKKEHDRAFARMRREKEALERQLDELRAAKEQPKVEETEEKTDEIHPVLLDVVKKHQEESAEKEFNSIEARTKRQLENYDHISAEYKLALAQSVKTLNPRMTDNEVWDITKRQILTKAAQYVRQGLNPVEEMYNEALDLGFTGKSFMKEEQEAKEEKLQPDMKKVAANRRRSTGMATATGESRAQLTKQAASELSVAEWAKLSPVEKHRLLYS